MIVYLNFYTFQNDRKEGKIAKDTQRLDILLVCYQAKQYIIQADLSIYTYLRACYVLLHKGRCRGAEIFRG